METFPRVTWIA